MFVLVESFRYENLLFEPDLGCAYLIAAMHASGIETQFVHGQVKFLPLIMGKYLDDILWGMESLDSKKYPVINQLSSENRQMVNDEISSLLDKFYFNKEAKTFFDYRETKKYFDLFNYIYSAFVALIDNGSKHSIPLIDHYVNDILSSNPKCIGFSITRSFDSFSRAIRKRIKEITDIPIVVGGSYTPFIEKKSYMDLFENEFFDYLVVGEGEEALPQLFMNLVERKTLNLIPNIYYRTLQGIDGTFPTVIKNLDLLPDPDYSLFDLDHYFSPEKILSIQTSRGCSWGKCAFCSHETSALGNYRFMSTSRIVEMIEKLSLENQTSYFSFHDAEISSTRILEISKAVNEHSNLQKKMNFICYCRLEKPFSDVNTMQTIKEAGFHTIQWGLESGSQKVLNLMKKGINVDIAGDILETAWKCGIGNFIFIILAFPGETEIERQQTIKFITDKSHAIQLVLSGNFGLESQSPIGKNPEKWGIKINQNGTWQTNDNSMSSHEGLLIRNKFWKILSTGLVGGKYAHYFGEDLNNLKVRLMAFIFNSHGWVNTESVSSLINNPEVFLTLYPIVMGTFHESDQDSLFFSYYNYSRPFIFDQLNKQQIWLSPISKRIIELSNGENNIDTVIVQITKEFSGEFREDVIFQKIMGYYKEVIGLGGVLFFRIPFLGK